MKWGELFRPRYLHSDPSIRHEALAGITDTGKLRRIFSEAGRENIEIQLEVAFLLKDRQLLYDLLTDRACWHFTGSLSADNVATLVGLGYTREECLALSKSTASFPMELALLKSAGRYDRVRAIIVRTYKEMQDSRLEVLRGTYDAGPHEGKIMTCLEALPDAMLDAALLDTLHHAVLFNKRLHAQVIDRYRAAGWASETVNDVECPRCKGAKTEFGKFEEGSWQVQCSTCRGTGVLPPFVRMTKGDQRWDDNPYRGNA